MKASHVHIGLLFVLRIDDSVLYVQEAFDAMNKKKREETKKQQSNRTFNVAYQLHVVWHVLCMNAIQAIISD